MQSSVAEHAEQWEVINSERLQDDVCNKSVAELKLNE